MIVGVQKRTVAFLADPGSRSRSMYRRGVIGIIIVAICLAVISSGVFPVLAADAVNTAAVEDHNLLVNPDLENDMEGWTAAAMDESDFYHGISAYRSCIYQDIPLEGIDGEQKLKLSGRIAISPEDLSQQVIEMGMAIYDADGNMVQDMQTSQEAGRELTLHDIVMEVPEGASYARVFLTIYKRRTQNIFNCENLCLEVTNGGNDTAYTVTNLNIPDDAVSWNGHYYAWYDDAEISWTMAENYCGINHGHLAAISSEEEQVFLENAFPGTNGWIGEEENARLSDGRNQEDASGHAGYYCEWDSDMVTYEQDGLSGGNISDETKQLLEDGKGYYYGTGTEGYDIDKAWDCFASATDEQSAEAWYYLGEIMASGKKDTGRDPYLRAMGAYEKAIEYGLDLGWMGQGDLYLNGRGVPVDYGRALQLYQRAVQMGCTEANYGLGVLYQHGLGVEEDGVKAVEYYQKAAESADYGWRNMARDALGDIYYEGCSGIGPDYSQARTWYMAGAQEGYGPCCNDLGYMYYQGNGVEQDYAQAAYWFEMAASRGDRDGCYNLAFLYENGTGVEQNYSLALEYYKKAALMGDIWSMYFLGCLYEEGLGTEKDYVLARECYQKILDSEEAGQELKDSAGEKMARIQTEEAEALTNEMDQLEEAGQNGGITYGGFGESSDVTIDYSAFGWNPDGTVSYGDGTISYGDAAVDPGIPDTGQEGTIDADSNVLPQDGDVTADSSVLPQDGDVNVDVSVPPGDDAAGIVNEEITG